MAAYEWVDLDFSSGPVEIPPTAIAAGGEYGKPTYVARVNTQDGWELGKLNAWATFTYSYFGEEISSAQGQVLVATGDHHAVWINSAFGEEVPSMMTSPGPGHTQYVSRAWHKGRWVPGKVVPFCRMMFFPFGRKEMSTRKYQLLSTDFVWQHLNEDSGPSCAVPKDPGYPSQKGHSNCIPLLSPPSWSEEVSVAPSQPCVLVRQSAEEACWVVSGDGEYVRHAVTANGFQVARVWHASEGSEGWAICLVHPQTRTSRPGAYHNQQCYTDYQVLTTGRGADAAPRMLSLSISLETLRSVGGVSSSALPQDIFLVSKLQPGENPWTAVKEMVTDLPELQSPPEVAGGLSESFYPSLYGTSNGIGTETAAHTELDSVQASHSLFSLLDA